MTAIQRIIKRGAELNADELAQLNALSLMGEAEQFIERHYVAKGAPYFYLFKLYI